LPSSGIGNIGVARWLLANRGPWLDKGGEDRSGLLESETAVRLLLREFTPADGVGSQRCWFSGREMVLETASVFLKPSVLIALL
jgi:hypothetical protein